MIIVKRQNNKCCTKDYGIDRERGILTAKEIANYLNLIINHLEHCLIDNKSTSLLGETSLTR